MNLIEERDLATNDLLASYDVTEAADVPGIIRALRADLRPGSCLVQVERDTLLGPAMSSPDPLPEPLPVDEQAPEPDAAVVTTPAAAPDAPVVTG